jgi:hypothetical protein
VPEGDNGKGQLAEAIGKLVGPTSINIFFLDLTPDVRKEIRELKEVLRDLAQSNLDQTINAKIVREAFSMSKKKHTTLIISKTEISEPKGTLLSSEETRLIVAKIWSAEDFASALKHCEWDRRLVASRFGRNYAAILIALRKHGIEHPDGHWPRKRKVLRSELPTP